MIKEKGYTYEIENIKILTTVQIIIVIIVDIILNSYWKVNIWSMQVKCKCK